jgi:hypothetical protein
MQSHNDTPPLSFLADDLESVTATYNLVKLMKDLDIAAALEPMIETDVREAVGMPTDTGEPIIFRY